MTKKKKSKYSCKRKNNKKIKSKNLTKHKKRTHFKRNKRKLIKNIKGGKFVYLGYNIPDNILTQLDSLLYNLKVLNRNKEGNIILLQELDIEKSLQKKIL